MTTIDLIHSGPSFLESCLRFLNSAKDEICISTFRFENPENKKTKAIDLFFLSLIAAKNRKVKIKILVNLFSEKERLGQINKKTAMVLKTYGITCRRPPARITNHAKLLIIDRKRLILGSHNITKHSFNESFECSIKITDHKMIDQVCNVFDTAYNLATPIC